MVDGDVQATISGNLLRLGELGRGTARSTRSLPDGANALSFADSLAEAIGTPLGQTHAGHGGPIPIVSLVRPEGRHLGPVQFDGQGNVVAMSRPPVAGAAAQMASAQANIAAAAAAHASEIDGSIADVSLTAVDASADLFLKASGTSAAATGGTGTATVNELKDYPRPSRSDRSGVLNWNSVTPPTGRELETLVTEARHRKVGWVTFVADPEYPQDYIDLVDRQSDAGIQPVARVQDPEGDLPVRDVRALVQELKEHGVHYFQLFDGANVAAETPDGHVDVREYADRWLPAARAVVEAGGLPGVGALDPHGDYDDRGFMRQLLSAVKERGGTDVLGQSWLALRGETAGAAATSTDVGDLAERASWFDRINRRELGRSLPILATGDPAGRPERLTPETVSTATSPTAAEAESALRDSRRKLPALFGASRGTLAPSRR
jgi:hypothetical protein